jgi:hypothetical protein
MMITARTFFSIQYCFLQVVMSADIEGDGGDAMKSRYTVLSLSLLLFYFILFFKKSMI